MGQKADQIFPKVVAGPSKASEEAFFWGGAARACLPSERRERGRVWRGIVGGNARGGGSLERAKQARKCFRGGLGVLGAGDTNTPRTCARVGLAGVTCGSKSGPDFSQSCCWTKQSKRGSFFFGGGLREHVSRVSEEREEGFGEALSGEMQGGGVSRASEASEEVFQGRVGGIGGW